MFLFFCYYKQSFIAHLCTPVFAFMCEYSEKSVFQALNLLGQRVCALKLWKIVPNCPLGMFLTNYDFKKYLKNAYFKRIKLAPLHYRALEIMRSSSGPESHFTGARPRLRRGCGTVISWPLWPR